MPTRVLQAALVQAPGVLTQAPSWHTSVVQASPSSQAAALLVWTQPATGSQLSSVQGLASSQLNAGAPVQTPFWLVSAVVEMLASSRGAAVWACGKTLAGSLASSVEGLASPQLAGGALTQVPSWQTSPAVHALPSSQAAVLLVCRQPPAPSQASSVQGLPSSQRNWPTQAPPWQASFTVQVLPSSQGPGVGEWWQPRAGAEESPGEEWTWVRTRAW